MSDGVEILTENHKEAREFALLGRVDSNIARCYLSLDEALTRLERDRDALAERCEKLREALRDATQIVEQYVAHNPTWTNGIGKTQDPMGAHALLSRMLLLAAPKDAP